MADVRAAVAAGDLSFVQEAPLHSWAVEQRWFGSKAREIASFNVLEAVALRDDSPLLILALCEARFATGTHELYQLPLGLRPAEDGWGDRAIVDVGGWSVYDALADPALSRELLADMEAGRDLTAAEGTLTFRWTDAETPTPDVPVRPMGVEQSNSSLVFGDQLVLKVFRRVEPGVNPELELLRFLTERGFHNIPSLAGWYAYEGRLMDATLAIVQRFLAGGRDGWELCLEDIEAFLPRLAGLGAVTGRMHSVLGSEFADPAFTPEEPSTEALSLLTATVDEQIERLFADLPDSEPVAPIAGRGQDVRERLQVLSHIGAGGKVIRTHGDYHLGQTMLVGDEWAILDFEGEPARSLPERRQKRSPLRDVAGMLRSFAYAASAQQILRGVEPPGDWEERARETFLHAYFESVEPSLLPPGQQAIGKLLSVYELEKAVYELRYELNNRPDWVGIPVAGIARLLEDS
jgi:maltokinase